MAKNGGSPADDLENNSNANPFGTKVDELWSITTDRGSTPADEKLDDLLESITDTLVQLQRKVNKPSWVVHSPLELKEPVIKKLFETSMKIINLRYLFTKNKQAIKKKFEKLDIDPEFAETFEPYFKDPDD